MSLLGAMLVRRVVKKIKDKDVIGLEYIFYDTIIQNYSSQDNLQVQAIVRTLITKIKDDYNNINKLFWEVTMYPALRVTIIYC